METKREKNTRIFLELNDGILSLKELIDIIKENYKDEKEISDIYSMLDVINRRDDIGELDTNLLIKLSEIALDNELILFNLYMDYLRGEI